MEKSVLKIGQELEITHGFEIQSAINDKVFKIKNNDKGFVSSDGVLTYTTGEARGKKQAIDLVHFEIKGYDHHNIACIVFDYINKRSCLSEMLGGYDYDKDDFIKLIEEALEKIL